MGKVRVMQVVGSLHLGGEEKVVHALAEKLCPERFSPSVCGLKAGGVLADDMAKKDVPVHILSSGKTKRVYFANLRLARLIKKEKPDVLHSHGTVALLDAAVAVSLHRVPILVHTFHFGNYPHYPRRYMIAERLAAKSPDFLVAVSHCQRDSLVEHYSLAPRRIRVVHNGVPANPHLESQSLKKAKRRELNIADTDTVLGTVALLSRQKGVEYMIEAAADVMKEKVNVKLVIVGDGPLRERLEKKARDTGLGDRIIFTGLRRDIPEILPLFHVFLMSSLWEGLPLSLLEAMAAGVPVVATDVGDNRKIVDDGKTGFLVPPREPGKMSDAIQAVLGAEERRSLMGKTSLEKFRSTFVLEKMVAEYENLYEEGLAARRGGRE